MMTSISNWHARGSAGETSLSAIERNSALTAMAIAALATIVIAGSFSAQLVLPVLSLAATLAAFIAGAVGVFFGTRSIRRAALIMAGTFALIAITSAILGDGQAILSLGK